MANNSTEIAKSILDAIEIISEKATSTAEFASTIEGVIVQCQDASIGKYLVKYQDSLLTAYTDPAKTYAKNTLVYILVPKNDLRQYKVIIGSSKQLGTDFIDNFYNFNYQDVGTSVLQTEKNFAIKMKTNDEKDKNKKLSKTLYSKEDKINELSFSESSMNSQIKNSNLLKLTGKIQTNLSYQNKRYGNYGIKITVLVRDAATGESKNQEFFFDANHFIGNPYEYNTPSSQTVYCPIDNINFIRIQKIECFTQNFLKKDEDIYIYDFSINGSYKLSEDEKNSVTVLVSASKGYTFFKGEDTKTFQAKVKANMKEVNLKEQNVQIYWFKQDLSIVPSSEQFLRYGGEGWKCLNPREKNTIKSSQTLKLGIDEVTYAKQTNFKCVAYYNGQTYSRNFVVINNTAKYKFVIESSEGDTFHYSTGYPTLTFKGFDNNGEEIEYDDYILKWQVCNYQNVTTYLKESPMNYDNALTIKEEIEGTIGINYLWGDNPPNNKDSIFTKYIDDETKTYQAIYNKVCATVKKLEKVQRVRKNCIYNLDLHTIINFSIFRCACYEKTINEKKEEIQKLIGAASIKIKNTQAPSQGYSLIINNGEQNFLYNEDGISLCHEGLDNPYQISDLSYSFFENGKQIEKSQLKNNVSFVWKVPISKTLLKINIDDFPKQNVSQQNGYYLIKNENSLSIKVSNTYNPNYTNNDIYLFLKYKNQEYIAKTNFTFTKQGQNGTNGTKYYFKIKGNNYSDAIAKIKANSNSATISLQPQLWRNGAQEEITTDNKFNCNILQNKIEKNNSTTFLKLEGSLTKNSTNNSQKQKITVTIKDGKHIEDILKNNALENLIQMECSKGGFKYYATIPIITIKTYDSNYEVNLDPSSGFRYVTYKKDGTNPSYDNRTPFKVEVFKITNQNKENVTSYVPGGKPYLKYEWKVIPNDDDSLMNITSDKNSNTCKVVPKILFTRGNQVNNALFLTIKKDEKLIAEVHIPIHFMLNRYENKFLNDWDGTAIQIKENQGYILTPQMGAGKKNTNNTFTGIVIGVEKTPIRNEQNKIKDYSEQIGLFGYSQGSRSIFLDAKTGNATFGRAGEEYGQIIIDVNNKNGAKIKSGDYTGPTGNRQKDKEKTGMQIQFAGQPHIYFSSGNFKVDSQGHITARGGGNIAGWQIRDNKLFNGSVGMAPSIWNHHIDDDEKKSESKNYTGVFWAGRPDDTKIITTGEKNFAERNFFVTGGGFLFSKSGQIAGWDITANSISKKVEPENKNPGTSVKISSSIGKAFSAGTIAKTSDGNLYTENFYVQHDGYLFSKLGRIGGWDILDDRLVNKDGNVGMSTGLKISNIDNPICFWGGIKNNNDQIDIRFYVSNDGYLFSKYAKIGNWFIGTGGLYSEGREDETDKPLIYTYNADNHTYKEVTIEKKTSKIALKKGKTEYTYDDTTGGVYVGSDGIRFGDYFHVTQAGGLYATGGQIGKINIDNSGLSANNWRIDGSGTAYFTNAYINGSNVVDSIIKNASHISGNSGGISGGGMRVGASGGGASGSYMEPGALTGEKGKTWDAYIDEKIKGFLTKSNIVKLLTGVGIDAESAGTAIGLSGITINAKDLYVTDHIDGKTLYVTNSISIGKNSVVTTADLSDYAKSSDLEDLKDRVSALERSNSSTP